MHNNFDIVIAGNGLVGKSLALSLGQGGFRVALLGQDNTAQNRVLSLAPAPWKWLQQLTPEQNLARHAQPVNEIQTQAGKIQAVFRNQPDTPLSYIIEETNLNPALSKQINNQNNIRHIHADLHSFETGNHGVCCQADNLTSPLTANLLAGCDGTNSMVRKQAGIACNKHQHQTSALNCIIQQYHTTPHSARQNFLPDGPLALLPMLSGQTGMIFTAPNPLAKALMALDDASFVTELRARSNDFTKDFRLVSTRSLFPISRHIATQFHAPRLALAGDAAHRIHPLAGQGLNMGLADAACLSAILRQYRRCGLDHGSEPPLAAYEKMRKSDSLTMTAATETLARIFKTPETSRFIAGISMHIWSRIGILRQFSINMACHSSTFANIEKMDKAA